MKHILILFGFLFFGLKVTLGKTDSTIFSTEFEQEVFESLEKNGSIDPWLLFIAMDYSQNKAEIARNEMDNLIRLLDKQGVESKKVKAQVKTIYKTVHSRTLKKYEETVAFSRLFSSGRYNCVSGTAVYAMLMDNYDIPYSIKELPNHVYLVADPDGLNMIVESTIPNRGVVSIDKKAKVDYVKFLRDHKLISEEEYKNSSVEELFKQQYEDETNIGLHELAAFEYYNKGLIEYRSEQFEKSFANFEKAFRIYPSFEITYLLYSSLMKIMHDESMEGNFNGRHLANFVNRFSANTESRNSGLSYYEMAINSILIENADLEKFESFHSDFMELVNDSITLSEFQKVYYNNRAYYYYSQDNFTQALKDVSVSYMLNDKDLKTKNFIKSVATEYIYNQREKTGIIDTMDYFFTVYPFLLDDYRVSNLYVYTYANLISTAVDKNQISLAIQYLNRMESSIDLSDLQRLDPSIVEACYSSIVVYYGQKENEQKAGVYVQKGLEVLPDSRILKEYKEMLAYKPPTPTLNTSESKNSLDYFSDNFPNCWRSAYAISEDGSEEIPEEEAILIEASGYAKVTVTLDGEVISGRWAYRAKSKLLYLIPEDDKEDYLMFKVYRCDKLLEVRLYEGKTLMKPKIYFEKCN